MRSTKDGNNVVPPTSSSSFPPDPDEVAPNAINAEFLRRLEEQEEPPTASEADLAGPWRVEALPEEQGGGFGLFREGESLACWQRTSPPFSRFDSIWTAELVAALLPGLGRDAAYRFQEERDARGWGIQSREAWGAVIGHVQVFDPALIEGLHVLDGLMRSPRALARFLEACGKVALERAGAILAARVGERMPEEEEVEK
jgi:hypothetical protein